MSTRPTINEPQLAEAQSHLSTRCMVDQMDVAALDIAFQAAVKHNDAETIANILHPQFVMVLGDGTVVSRDQILESARARVSEFEIQDEDAGTQSVRVWGDTAVVTARLHVRAQRRGEQVDRRVWFSDTYVRTEAGWRYAFAQVSLPLPDGLIG